MLCIIINNNNALNLWLRERERVRVKPAGKCVRERERERERKRISRYVSNLTKMNATWGKKQMIYEHLHLLPLEQHSLSPI